MISSAWSTLRLLWLILLLNNAVDWVSFFVSFFISFYLSAFESIRLNNFYLTLFFDGSGIWVILLRREEQACKKKSSWFLRSLFSLSKDSFTLFNMSIVIFWLCRVVFSVLRATSETFEIFFWELLLRMGNLSILEHPTFDPVGLNWRVILANEDDLCIIRFALFLFIIQINR